MCGGYGEGSPEDKLAALMNADLGISVSPREVRMFVKANWRKIAAYAHSIHDAGRDVDAVAVGRGDENTTKGC